VGWDLLISGKSGDTCVFNALRSGWHLSGHCDTLSGDGMYLLSGSDTGFVQMGPSFVFW